MIFEETPVAGCVLVRPEPHRDARGFFARTHCETEFAEAGLTGRFAQSSISYNARRCTVRGMHYQTAPHREAKLVRCVAGAVCDAVIDLRPDSPSFRAVAQVELTAENRAALYIPPGPAHGFQTLTDDAELLYMIDVPHAPGHGAGLRWDDPGFDLRWPEPVTVISDRDRAFPDWRPERSGAP